MAIAEGKKMPTLYSFFLNISPISTYFSVGSSQAFACALKVATGWRWQG